MKILSVLAAGALAVAAGAQTNTLSVNPTGGGFTWNGATGAANFIDLDVQDPSGITLQAFSVPVQNPGGTVGQLDFWITPTTHVGNETNQGLWTQIGSAELTSAGFGVLNTVCVEPTTSGSTFLAQGQYGLAIVYTDLRAQFFGVTTYPSGPYTAPGLSVDNGGASAAAWTGAPLTNFTSGGTTYLACVPNLDVLYAIGNLPHACATISYTGEGSNIKSVSAFDLFDEPNAAQDAAAALTGNSLSFIPNGSGTGYIMTPGVATYVAPTGGQTPFAAADNAEYQVTLAVPLQIPSETGVQLSFDLFVNTNGIISFDQTPGGISASPLDPQGNMQADSTSFFIHHNFDSSLGGEISYEEDAVNGKTYVSYVDVPTASSTSTTPSTVQFQIDHFSGQIDLVFETIDAANLATIIAGDNWLIGWTPAGPSPRTDEFDFTTLTSLTLELPEILPLTVASSTVPLIGQSFDITTSNAPTQSVGANLLAVSQLPSPLDLSVLGAPAGAVTYLDPTQSILNTVSNIPGLGSMTLNLPVANIPALAGLQIYSQTFWLDLAGNPFPFDNIVSSNLLTATVGNF